MNDELITSEPITLPYFVVDAFLERGLRALERPLSTQRKQLSTGSVRIMLLVNKKPFGRIDLMAITAETTLFEVHMPLIQPTSAQDTLRSYLGAFSKVFLTLLAKAEMQSAQINIQLTEFMTYVRALNTPALAAPKETRQPKRGDTIDAWLDWRDREQQHTGRRISLTYIAREGDFKIDTLKKRSAARRREQMEEAEEDYE